MAGNNNFYCFCCISGLTALLSSAVISPSRAQETGQTVKLKEIVVTGTADRGNAPGIQQADGYVVKSGRTAIKTDMPLHETAQSVSGVTQKQLQDRKPQNLLEALEYTSGVNTSQYGFDPRYDAFKIRGIDLTYTGVFRDGLRQANSPSGLYRLETYGLEGISILKGPAASLYGASSSGGIVDLITKRPTEDPLREIVLETGSYKRLHGAFDFSGPLNSDSTLLGRLTGVIRKADTEFGDFFKDDRVYIAPALTWQPDADTKLTLLGSYMDSVSGGTASYLNRYDPVTGKSTGATHDFGGDPRFNDFRVKQGSAGYEFEHRLSDATVLHQNLRYSRLSNSYKYVFDSYPGYTEEKNNGLAADTYLETDLNTGAVSHKIITGIDLGRFAYTSNEGSGTQAFTPDDFYRPALTNQNKQKQTQSGIYIQDQLQFDAWRVTLGLRHDWLQSDLTTGSFSGGFTDYARKDSETTGRAAVGYVLDNGLMPYISYGTSFIANPGVLQSNDKQNPLTGRHQAMPTTGKQIEAGVKYAVPDYNAYSNFAVFNIDQTNASIYETSSGVNEQIQLDMRSRGFEAEAGAILDNGLSLIAAYSYNDVKILRLTEATNGNVLNASPYHSASLWADYMVESGPLTGLGLSAGIRYTGSSFGDNTHTIALDNKPLILADAALRYDLVHLNPQLDGMQLQVNASNLLNKVRQTCSSGFCYWNEGRKIIASMRYRF